MKIRFGSTHSDLKADALQGRRASSPRKSPKRRRYSLPEGDLQAVAEYCEAHAGLNDGDHVFFRIWGPKVTILMHTKGMLPGVLFEVAQLRYTDYLDWELYWADRSTHWHHYEDMAPTARINDVLRAIDHDTWGVFWG